MDRILKYKVFLPTNVNDIWNTLYWQSKKIQNARDSRISGAILWNDTFLFDFRTLWVGGIKINFLSVWCF